MPEGNHMNRKSGLSTSAVLLGIAGLACLAVVSDAGTRLTSGAYLRQSLRLVGSFEASSIEIREALRSLFSQAAGLSYSISPEVQGSVTISVRNMPFDALLKLVLQQVDAGFDLESGIYSISKKRPNPKQQIGPQGGFGGGGFGGRGFGWSGGERNEVYDRSVKAIESAVLRYLDTPEIKNILTPGEFSEWPLNLKAGQVVIADAKSDAFDPALEVVDGQGEGTHKVLATNDDRYPGDQRPLLLWRCTKDGAYSLRARCFRDKSGGQFFLRLRVFESLDIDATGTAQRQFERSTQFLVRVPMKAGQVKRVIFEGPRATAASVLVLGFISPIGLPNAGLGRPIEKAAGEVVVAPVDGDYYVNASCDVFGPYTTVRAEVQEVKVVELAWINGVAEAKAASQSPGVFAVDVKKGQIIEASTPDLSLFSRLEVAEAPDFSSFSLAKPESNPFFPVSAAGTGPNADPVNEDSPKKEALRDLSARPRDGRFKVFVAMRDARVWIATSGNSPSSKPFSVHVAPADRDFALGNETKARLKVGGTDFWRLEAKTGDVLQFSMRASDFAEQVTMFDPDMKDVFNVAASAESDGQAWTHVVQSPGTYLIAVSSIGWGGGGDYTLKRSLVPAKEFRKGSPAIGAFAQSDVEVWKFTAKENDPQMIHWKWEGGAAGYAQSYNEAGRQSNLPVAFSSGDHSYGFVNVERATTFVIVFTKPKPGVRYQIELLDIPNLPPRKGSG